MLPDRVSNPGPLTYESGALPIALRGPAPTVEGEWIHFQGKELCQFHFCLIFKPLKCKTKIAADNTLFFFCFIFLRK